MIIQTNNDFERGVLEEFKKKVEDLEQDEITLTRFLRARDFDIPKAENMLRQSLQWRKEQGMDHILESWDPPKYLSTALQYAITGIDYEGGPVFWIPFGSWTHRSWVEEGRGDELLKWSYRFIEEGMQCLKNNREGRHQVLAIFDLENLTFYNATHIPSLRVLYSGFKALEANFPEILKSVVILNAPWLFTVPYNFLKASIHQNTLNKLKIFDSNKKVWLNYLLERCPQKALPPKYFEDENGN